MFLSFCAGAHAGERHGRASTRRTGRFCRFHAHLETTEINKERIPAADGFYGSVLRGRGIFG